MLCILFAVSCAPNSELAAEVCSPTPMKTQDPVFETSWEASGKSKELDATFSNYIVQFKQLRDRIRHGIQPSGNSVREYGVAQVKLRSIGNNSYTLNFSEANVQSLQEKQAVLRELAQDQSVEFVEPDFPITRAEMQGGVPNDKLFGNQWSHKIMDSLDAWKLTRGSRKIVVAVVDTGIDFLHRDLKENMWINPGEKKNGIDDDRNGYIDDIYGWNFSANNNNPRTTPKSNHGSHVAGIIGATGNNSIGVVGIAPEVQLMALKFMGETGSGATSDAIKAIDYAVAKKVFLINNSWGSKNYSRALLEAIQRAAKAGVLFVAAAGNGENGTGYDIEDTAWYPASYPISNIISVAATDDRDQLTRFSNFAVNKVDVAAPGFSILSTVSGEGYQTMSGTSMAAPYVAGMAVLVKAANPSLSPRRIIDVIRNSVDRRGALQGRVLSGGRINAHKAVLAAHQCSN